MSDQFDYQEILNNWSVEMEQRKADFMEHMYQCSARTNGLYTGLWHDFCVSEAGPIMRDRYFEMVEAVKQFEQMKQEQQIPA